MKFRLFIFFILFTISSQSQALTAVDLIKKAMEQWRGKTSYIQMSMLVHRPDWQREMKMDSWNEGEDNALVRFTYPKKDAGSASLTLDREMWIYTPKLNRVIKLPGSMMSQSWMGSDFSYSNLAKSDSIIDDYTHKLLKTEEKDGLSIYTIESIPKESAAVVWGKERVVVRSDFILLEETFFDQDMIPVKKMVTTEVGPIDGREYAIRMRMIDLTKEDHWTEVVTENARFDINLPAFMFTRSNLQNPRRWSPQ